MKKYMTMLMITAAVAVTPAFAQSANLRANIEHEFVVNGKTMPAGEYTVVQNTGSELALVRGIDGKPAAMTMTQASQYNAPQEAHLAFRNVNGKYYLTGFGGNGGTREVRSTASEAGRGGVLSFVKAARVR